jgi:hypothetical protein
MGYGKVLNANVNTIRNILWRYSILLRFSLY